MKKKNAVATVLRKFRRFLGRAHSAQRDTSDLEAL
jgi:hypothetical protein